MKNVLISGLGGSLFPYLHDQLKDKYNLFYIDNNSSIKEIYKDYNFFLAPAVKDTSYADFVREVISKYQIDIYMPLIDEEILVAHEIVKNSSLPIFLFTPEKSFSELCLDKYKLMKKLSELNLSHIQSWTGSDFKWSNHHSIFVKPNHGRGSRGIRTIHSEAELQAYYQLEKISPAHLLIQDKIEGVEYTVGLMTNQLNQILSIVPKKVLLKKGITIKAVIDNDPNILALCEKINEVLKPKGAINIQLFKTSDGTLKIFEINPRFSTTSIMSFASGIDEFSLLLDHYNTTYNKKYLVAKQGLILYRRWENIFYE